MLKENNMLPKIKTKIKEIEKNEKVKILYACESGSRAWGFESQNSDYDVRFIYLRKTEWYLTIQDKRDVIEYPIEDDLYDVSGWDLTKALKLLRKSNPPLMEWFQSPIVYQENKSFTSAFRKLMKDYFSPIGCMYHYLKMAQNNYRAYLRKERVQYKKYLYALRPVLACLWIEKGLGVVPTEFKILYKRLIKDKTLKKDILRLLEIKRKGMEKDSGPRIPSISNFLDRELERLDPSRQKPAESRDVERLDRFFKKTLSFESRKYRLFKMSR